MEWAIVLTFAVSSLLTAAIVFAGLWLGWIARDKVGQERGETPVGPPGSTEDIPESVMFLDYEPREVDEQDPEA